MTEAIAVVSKLQPTWVNAPTKGDLYNDYTSASNGQEDYRSKLREYKANMKGGVVPKVRKGKSTAVSLLVREHVEWTKPALSEAILSTKNMFKISPIGSEDVLGATQNSLVINNQWSNKISKVPLVDRIVEVLTEEGTVIVKTGWESVDGVKEVKKEQPVFATPEQLMQMVQQGQIPPEQAQQSVETGQPIQIGTEIVYVEEPTLIKNQPTYEVCNNANITIDPTCDGIVEDAKFAIYEFNTNYAELVQYKYSKDKITGEESGFYHNTSVFKSGSEGGYDYDEFISDESNNFKFDDSTRKRLKAYEYWGYWDIQGDGVLVSIVATWINNTLVRLEENPFPHGRIPFSTAAYMPRKGGYHGEPDGELLKQSQARIGRMGRAIDDKTAEDAVGQKFIHESFLKPSAKNAMEKGNTTYYSGNMHPKDAIWKNDVQPLGSTQFDIITKEEKKAAELSGGVAFTGPSSNPKLGGGVPQKSSMDATAQRKLSVLRRLGAMFEDMARMTISMNQVYLSETEIVRATGDQFITIARDDLEGRFDFNVEISTPEKDGEQANRIMTLMQTNAASQSPETVKMMYVKMLELWKMPEEAQAIREQQPPPPDSRQERMLDLQIQEQELKNGLIFKQIEAEDSKIFERMSRVDENLKADIAKKQAEALKATAAADKMNIEVDIATQAFIDMDSGKKREEDLEDRELDAIYKERETEQNQANDIDKAIRVVI
jgi:hypothetical protein